MSISRSTILLAAFSALAIGCGKSGERETRPIEVLFKVTRPTGASFRVVAIATADNTHVLPDEDLTAPHLFVVENGFQPVTAIVKNLDDELPITVELAFGPQIQSRQEIPPGECCTIEPGRSCAEDPGPCAPAGTCLQNPDVPCSEDSDCPGFDSGETCALLDDGFPDIRMEIRTAAGADNVGFNATLGDQSATNITSCVLGADICRTPATFFLEEAEDAVSAVFTKFSDQDPDAVLAGELFIDGVLVDTDEHSRDVILTADL